MLVFIHLEHTALNNARVSQRTAEGGHDVPEEKVNERIPRTLQNLRQALPLCDRAYFLDNSRSDNPFRQIVELREGQITAKQQPLPQWAEEVVADYLR